jgi:hypothetical protein
MARLENSISQTNLIPLNRILIISCEDTDVIHSLLVYTFEPCRLEFGFANGLSGPHLTGQSDEYSRPSLTTPYSAVYVPSVQSLGIFRIGDEIATGNTQK